MERNSVNKLNTLADMHNDHSGERDRFLRDDPKRQRVLPNLSNRGRRFEQERDSMLMELEHSGTRIFSHEFTTRDQGHGFGLHSAAMSAQQLGGGLWAESAGPGHGAVFTLELPLKRKTKEEG